MQRIVLAAALALLASALPSRPARAGDEAAEAAVRLVDKYGEGVEGMSPDEVDGHRGALLEPVVASGSAVGFQKLLGLAKERAEQVKGWKKRLKEIEEQEKAEAADKEPKKPVETGTARSIVEEGERRKRDKERIPGGLEREERWQKRLADATGALLDALPDADFAKVASPELKQVLGDPVEGWDDWMAAALGRSRRERTARILLEMADAALGEYRKALTARAGPAKELDRVQDDINKLVYPYIERRQKEGDYSGQYPSSLVPDALNRQRADLTARVGHLTSSMQETDGRRRTARRAFGGMLEGAPEDLRGRLLDVLEKEALASKDFDTRGFGLGALGPCPGDRAMKALREAAKDPVPEVVVEALEALGQRSEAEALEILSGGLDDPRWQVRAAAAGGLVAYGRALGVPHLIAAMAKAEGRTVDDLQAALERLTRRSLPPAAAAWEAWWAKEWAAFRGPRDPGAPAAKAGEGGGEGGGDRTLETGDGVSFYGIETKSQRILFVLDFSGSMNFAGSDTDSARKKIDVLYQELKKTLAGLQDGARFNIVGFSSDVRVWRKGPATRDAKVAKEAMDWVEKQKVLGSTNIYDALETAFKMMGVGAAKDKAYEPVFDTIFFMTDGTPTSGKVTDTTLLRGDVRRWNEGRKIRIHVIGMGGKQKGGGGGGRGGGGAGQDDIDRDFLKKLAEENNGDCVFR